MKTKVTIIETTKDIRSRLIDWLEDNCKSRYRYHFNQNPFEMDEPLGSDSPNTTVDVLFQNAGEAILFKLIFSGM